MTYEPLAIVGAACRFPGSPSLSHYWQLLCSGTSAIAAPPPDRPSLHVNGQALPGGYVHDLHRFDHAFFQVSFKEAQALDPQQRLALELSWEALEDAGIAADRIAGSDACVFMAATHSEYGWSQLLASDGGHGISPYASTGAALGLIANRVSYFLDLRGTSLTVDTACSSSLTALALACQNLWRGDSALALVGGVNLLLSPGPSDSLHKLGALSPDGRCRPFDAAANGYVRGEGAGVLVLKPLSAALRDGQRVYAIIRSAVINNDGKTNGLTAPSKHAQQELLRMAYHQAGTAPHTVHYVETHGTGTLLGDPIEAGALGAVVGTPRSTPCWIGSVKSSIGHLEAAAGMAGVIKAALMLHHRTLVPQVGFSRANPHIAFNKLNLQVNTEVRPWPSEGVARAGVSGFGFGGTNGHVVLESAPVLQKETPRPQPHALLLSGKNPLALQAQIKQIAAVVQDASDISDVCFTAATGRSHHRHRVALLADTREQLLQQLHAAAPTAPTRLRPGMVFVFPGIGPQWPGMGDELLNEPAFAAAVHPIDAHVQQAEGWSVVQALRDRDGGVAKEDTHIVQTCLFALQVGLAALWRAWGVVPTAVLGHSLGEVAAAHTAGILSIDDATRVVLARSALLQQARNGTMAAVNHNLQAVAHMAVPFGVTLSSFNGPDSGVVSGTIQAIEAFCAHLVAQNIPVRRLNAAFAGHSPHLTGVGQTLTASLQGLAPQAGTLPLYSTLTGDQAPGTSLDAAYWGTQICQPVRFAQALSSVHTQHNPAVYLELGPQPVLLPDMLKGVGPEPLLAASMRRRRSARHHLLSVVAELYTRQAPLNLDAVFAGTGHLTALPHYPWQRELARLDVHAQPTPTPALPMDVHHLMHWVRWQPAPLPEPTPHLPPTTWLLLADKGGVAETLATALRSQGHRVILAFAGATFFHHSSDHFTVRAHQAADIRRITRHASHVVHLWSLDSEDTGDLAEAVDTALLVLPPLTRAMLPRARLWCITRNTQAVRAGEAVHLGGSVLWGFARCWAHEHPSQWGGLIDIDTTPRVAPLVAEMLHGRADEVALRQGQRLVGQLETLPERPTKHAAPLRPDATYLITGGLGALGLQVAEHLIRRGARHLMLCSRTPLPPRKQWQHVDPESHPGQIIAHLAALERLGASVRSTALDVSNATAVARFVAQHSAENRPPIRGVIHAAGVLADSMAVNLARASMLRAARPKLQGAWNLHHALGPHLDFFVLVSSAAGTLGQLGAASYGAANTGLDAFAAWRRGLGLPATSIAFGPWAGAGMADGPHRQRLADAGVRSLSADTALACLDLALRHDVGAHTVAMDADWPRLAQHLPYAALLKHLAPASEQNLLPRLQSMPVAECDTAVVELLQAWVQALVGGGTAELSATLGDLGFDSLALADLEHRLRQTLHLAPSAGWVVSTLTLNNLLQSMLRHIHGEAPTPAPSPNAWLRRLSPVRASRSAVIAFPFAGADANVFHDLARALPEHTALYAVQLPGRGARADEPFAQSVDAMVPQLLHAMEALSEPQWVLLGYSLGGLLAFETALALQARHDPRLRKLIVAAARAPHVPSHLPAMHTLSDAALRALVETLGGTPPEALAHPEFDRLLLPVIRADLGLLHTHATAPHAPLQVPLHVLAGRHDRVTPPETVHPWQQHALHAHVQVLDDEAHFFLQPRQAEFVQAIVEVEEPCHDSHPGKARNRREAPLID